MHAQLGAFLEKERLALWAGQGRQNRQGRSGWRGDLLALAHQDHRALAIDLGKFPKCPSAASVKKFNAVANPQTQHLAGMTGFVMRE
jgi:hypothetical protein